MKQSCFAMTSDSHIISVAFSLLLKADVILWLKIVDPELSLFLNIFLIMKPKLVQSDYTKQTQIL
jgi:hypothetical protein